MRNNYNQKPKTVKVITIDGKEIDVSLTEIEDRTKKDDKIYKTVNDINQQSHYVDKKKWNELTAKANINGEGNIIIENHKGELIIVRRNRQKQFKQRKLTKSKNSCSIENDNKTHLHSPTNFKSGFLAA